MASSLVCGLSTYPTVLVPQGWGAVWSLEVATLRIGFSSTALTGVVAEEAAPPGLMLQLLSSAMARPQPWHPKPQLPAVSQAGACWAGPRSSVGKGEVGKMGRAAPSWTAKPYPTRGVQAHSPSLHRK